ncbi:MAG: SAM-dependent chlorinase/fluorinase [Anaerolineae bacterium]|nr:SAM-dependent chlorinase/fluorinase [Anaerolineae bacterium]
MVKPVPTITLLTDFGLQDGLVGAMKGVIHGIVPQAQLVDISHRIPPQNIRWTGFVLMTAYAFWPSSTIHVIVVDPGVGTARRAVAVQTPKGTFIAPDNGVLSHVLARETVTSAISLTDPAYWHHPVSPVFHGRDIFGPCAAHLAAGVPLAKLGTVVDAKTLVTFPVPEPNRHFDGHITAHIQHIDRFGNCITDFPGHWLHESEHWRIDVKDRVIEAVHQTFSDVPDGELIALTDSSGFMAIAVRNGNAAQAMGLALRDPVVLRPVSKETLVI